MKQQLVEFARQVLRVSPLRAVHKRKIQRFCFLTFPSLFRHLPAYQLWSLQNPAIADKELRKMDLPQKRSDTLEEPIFKSENPSILMVSHSLGGGTEHHLKQLGEKLEQEDVTVWALRSLGSEWVRLLPYDNLEDEGLIYHLETESELLLQQLELFDIRLIHVHHLVDFTAGFSNKIRSFAERLEIPYDFTAHDYLSICPRFTLYSDATRGYCGEPDVKHCSGCVKTYGSAAGKDVDVEKWRTDYAEFLNAARHVYTPDMDVKNRLERYLPDSTIINRPHWDEAEVTPLARKAGKKLRVLTLGGIAPHKGSMVLKECAEDAKKRGLDIEFTLIGFSDIDWQLNKFMTVTGPYKQAELPQMLKDGEFDMVFLPATWPETFNYTLSEILHFGIYPVSFEIGAIARRIREIGYGSVLPYKLYRYASDINDALLAITIEDAPVEKLKSAQASYANILDEYYNLEIKASS